MKKYAPQHTWSDVQALCDDAWSEYRAVIEFHIKQTPGARVAYVEVVALSGPLKGPSSELWRVRAPLDARSAEKWPTNFINALWQLLRELEADPWNWPAERRAQVRGEC